MTREQKAQQLKELSGGKVSRSIQRSKKNRVGRKGRKWLAEIALITKRQLRFQKKTQKQLAEEMGVTPQQVNKWLSGKENFTIDTVAQLSEAIGIDLLKTNLKFAEQEEYLPKAVSTQISILQPKLELSQTNKRKKAKIVTLTSVGNKLAL